MQAADPNVFFSERNEKQLENFVVSQFPDVQRKQVERISKTVTHYMNEVYDRHPEMSIQRLNQEVVKITMIDFNRYLVDQRKAFEETLTEDTSERFNRMQTERKVENTKALPNPPDFRINIQEDAPPAAEIFERMKKDREFELTAADSFLENDGQKNQFIESNFLQRQERDRENRKVPIFATAPITQAPPLFPEANPTLSLPALAQQQSVRPQDFIIKQDDVLSYKENEYNLFIYSADRNWTRETGAKENRYNFTVNFDPAGGNGGNGFTINPAAQIRFKNISRIEMVKAILPTEGLDPLYKSTVDTNVNTLSFPYVILRVPELENNNYGTDNNLDRSFGVLQYDAVWNTDSNSARKSAGYTCLIPKFMKCQKVYHPTPLATLNKLTIQVQRPDGTALSATPDAFSLSAIYGSGNVAGSEVYKDDNFGYIWLQTSNWFSSYSMAESERVVFSNIGFASNYSSAAGSDLVNFIQRPEGHLIVGTGITGATGAGLSPSTNSLGYMNTFIIASRFQDPTTGSTDPDYFGGSYSNTSTMFSTIAGVGLSAGKVLNLNHQAQYVFRVITRDLDSSARIRPDNL